MGPFRCGAVLEVGPFWEWGRFGLGPFRSGAVSGVGPFWSGAVSVGPFWLGPFREWGRFDQTPLFCLVELRLSDESKQFTRVELRVFNLFRSHSESVFFL